jgi:hypothetical protein
MSTSLLSLLFYSCKTEERLTYWCLQIYHKSRGKRMLRREVSVLGRWELDHGNEVQVWLTYLVSKELSFSPSVLQHLANCKSNVSTLWSLIYLNYTRRRPSKEEAKSITEIGVLLTLFHWTDYNTRPFQPTSPANTKYFILQDFASQSQDSRKAIYNTFSFFYFCDIRETGYISSSVDPETVRWNTYSDVRGNIHTLYMT